MLADSTGRRSLWPVLAAAAAVAAVAVALGAAVAWLPPLAALAAGLGLVAAAAIAAWPELGLLLIVAVTGGIVNYDALPYLSLGPISLHLTDLLLLYLLGLAALRLLVRRDFPFVATGLDGPLLLFYAAVVLATTIAILQGSVAFSLAVRELRIVTYWLGFFAVTQLIRSRAQLRRLFYGLCVLALVMAGLVMLQTAVPALPLVRVSAETLVTAGTEFAGVTRIWITGERLMYVMLIVCACLAVLAGSPRQRLLALAGAVWLGAWLFMSFQRNYWFTTACALALLGFLVEWRERWRAVRWGLLAVAGAALLLAIPDAPLGAWGGAALDRVFSTQQERLAYDTSAILRETELQYASRVIAEHPLFGVGLGNSYRPWMLSFDYLPSSTDGRGLTWYCHNAYVWIWVKAGTPSLLFFLWLCAAFVYRGLRGWRRLRDRWWRAVVLGFALAFAGQMISNLVAPNFIQSWILIVYPICMGISELLLRWERLPEGPRTAQEESAT